MCNSLTVQSAVYEHETISFPKALLRKIHTRSFTKLQKLVLKNISCEYLQQFYGMVWYGMVGWGMVWYGGVWYGMVWYGISVVWYGRVG